MIYVVDVFDIRPYLGMYNFANKPNSLESTEQNIKH